MEECFLLPRRLMHKWRHIDLKEDVQDAHYQVSIGGSNRISPSQGLRPRAADVRGPPKYSKSLFRQACEFVPPLPRESKCIQPLSSSAKGQEWNNSERTSAQGQQEFVSCSATTAFKRSFTTAKTTWYLWIRTAAHLCCNTCVRLVRQKTTYTTNNHGE
eukprot:scaffold240_cov369-Pavlova_lutheri.AAC.32